MILNIDLGSLYVKTSVIDTTKDITVHSEIIRLDKESNGVTEVLLNSMIDIYYKQFPIKKVFILPNLDHIECQIINHESIIESKYQGYVKKEIASTRKEEKKKQRMGSEYELPNANPNTQPLTFSEELTGNEVFHVMEKTTLMSSDIYLEYVNSEYLKGLNTIINSLGKEVSLISPIRALKYLPFPKGNRIVTNYGHKNIISIVIETTPKGEEFIVEVIKETIESGIQVDENELIEKHEELTLSQDPTYRGIVGNLRELKDKYPGYEMYSVGGNANYLQGDFTGRNQIRGVEPMNIPLAVENVLMPTVFKGYADLQYNSRGTKLKNQVLSIFNMSTKASETAIALIGDVVIAGLVIALVSSYGITAEHLKYQADIKSLQASIATYSDTGESKGRITLLEDRLEALQNGKTKNYYNISEFLNSIASPLEMESIDIIGKDIEIVAYADNVSLIKQFLETVKTRQVTNEYTKFSLSEKDIQTVYRNGRKVDRVVFRGRVY